MNLRKEIAALRDLSTDQLRSRYAEVFGEPTRSRHKQFLFKRVAWRIQALALGDLSERARKRADELANDADLRIRMPAEEPMGAVTQSFRVDGLKPGTVLTRDYKGKRVEVMVLEKGFDYRGEVFNSLSAVAKIITGSHWNGRLFFGLKGGRS